MCSQLLWQPVNISFHTLRQTAENQFTVFSTHLLNTTWWEPSKTKGEANWLTTHVARTHTNTSMILTRTGNQLAQKEQAKWVEIKCEICFATRRLRGRKFLLYNFTKSYTLSLHRMKNEMWLRKNAREGEDEGIWHHFLLQSIPLSLSVKDQARVRKLRVKGSVPE